MAWLEERGEQFHLCLRIGGRKLKRSLKTADQAAAASLLERAERRLHLLELGELELPEGTDLLIFLVSDGRRSQPVSVKQSLILLEFIERFRDSLPAGAMEANSLYTLNIHLQHVLKILRPTTLVSSVGFESLQRYINLRSTAVGRRGQPVSPTTIKKELSSFSSVWTWGLRMRHVKVPFPNKGLRFPKTTEKAPFQTWTEIERHIASGGLTAVDEEALWDCLYLRVEEIGELLNHVQRHGCDPCLHPMMLIAAHTGARRSEIVRAQKRDFDFVGGTLLLRECKRAKGRRTHRRIPMSDELVAVLQPWLAGQPGPMAFTEAGQLLTPERASDLLSRSLTASRWTKLRGWHVLRHSFVSNLASRGIDQRLIDEFVGHTTEAMRQRYRHLFPETKRAAIAAVYG
ncbi:MAG: tyrosine-type recombinase/integrase [Planctomycetaceae bacterium]|nr:tyrosine-type recombinase/integrase [Planctomycetaceae bacterium]